MRLDEMEISTRLANCLRNVAKLTTSEEVCRWSAADLLRINNMGGKTLAELIDAFEFYGLEPHPTWPDWRASLGRHIAKLPWHSRENPVTFRKTAYGEKCEAWRRSRSGAVDLMDIKAECIEVMARAILDMKGGLNYDYADFCRDAATVAFTACMERLKEPSDRMVEDGCDALNNEVSWRGKDTEPAYPCHLRPIWQAMIEAALAQGIPTEGGDRLSGSVHG